MPRAQSLDALFKDFSHPTRPGLALGVYRYGRPIYLKGFGSACAGRRVPISPRTTFNLGSVSKQFTAFCVLLLQDEGKLSLEHSVRAYFPELPKRFQGVKVRHLMHHNSGLPSMTDLFYAEVWLGKQALGISKLIRLIGRQTEMNFPPGQEFCYSNDGYMLLAELVRRTSGLSLAEFAHQRVFKPLGMDRTAFLGKFSDHVPDQAQGHLRQKGQWKSQAKKAFFVGAGEVWSCLEDLGRWERNFYEKTVGSAAVHRAMVRPGAWRLKAPGDLLYGGGLFLGTLFGHPSVSHNGAEGSFFSDYVRLPEQGLAAICLHNGDRPESLRSFKVLGSLLKRPLERAVRKRALPQAYGAFRGYYETKKKTAFWSVKPLRQGLLIGTGDADLKVFLNPKGRFQLQDVPYMSLLDLEFELLFKDGRALAIKHWRGGKLVKILRYVGRAEAKLPDAKALEGCYRSPRNGLVFGLKRNGTKLFYVSSSFPAVLGDQQKAFGPDTLVGSGGYSFVIERGARGQVKALTLSEPAGRIKKMRYLKLPKASKHAFKMARN